MPPTDHTWRSRVSWVVHHTRTAMALKTAVAASLAWLIARQIPGPAQEYSFYAPFGAVVTMYPTIARSARQTLTAVSAILLGAALAIAVDAVLDPDAAVLAVVVGVGVLLGGLPGIRAQSEFVPIAALFTLVLGQGAEIEYAGAYAGLFLLGALVSVVLNAAFPSFPVRQVDDALRRLRAALAEHLCHLAARLTDPDAESGDGPDRSQLGRLTTAARDAALQAEESLQGNRRARRARHAVLARRDTFLALERVVLLVDDLHALRQDEPWGQDVLRVPAELRHPMAAALDALAEAVTTVGLDDDEPGRRADVDAAVRDLAEALHRHDRSQGPTADSFIVATIITTLRRTLSVLTPADRIRLSPGPGG
jgi:uncharacterized membrane protein YgaE (UPF0421/DUF939 family)